MSFKLNIYLRKFIWARPWGFKSILLTIMLSLTRRAPTIFIQDITHDLTLFNSNLFPGTMLPKYTKGLSGYQKRWIKHKATNSPGHWGCGRLTTFSAIKVSSGPWLQWALKRNQYHLSKSKKLRKSFDLKG